jgi:hypothetical protein
MIEGIIVLLSTKVLYNHIRNVGGKYFSFIDNELSKNIYSQRFEINHQHKTHGVILLGDVQYQEAMMTVATHGHFTSST